MMTSLSSLAAALLLVACASPFGGASIAPGTPRDDVIARMGQPTGVVLLGNGA